MIGYLYKVTNKVNGLVYIGKSINFPTKIWDSHLRLALVKNSSSKFHTAIREFGVKKFTFEIIHEFYQDENEADWHFLHLIDQIEDTCIEDHNSVSNGYNTFYGCKINRNPKNLHPFKDINIYKEEMKEYFEWKKSIS